jgi:hypothetical protein
MRPFPAALSGPLTGVRPDADATRRGIARTRGFPSFSPIGEVGTALAVQGLRRTTRRARPDPETTMTIRLFRRARARRAIDGLKGFSIFAASAATGLMLGLTRLIAG